MDTPQNVLYEVTVTSAHHSAHSDDGTIDLRVNAPKELGGPGGTANPESLFAASFATCFHEAIRLVASGQGVDAGDSEVRATTRIGRDGQGYVWAVGVHVSLPGVDQEVRQRVVDQARGVCPIVRSSEGNLELDVRVD